MAPFTTEQTRRPLPLILVRGFGGLGVEDEKRIAYQGFNDGTVYPHKRGDNYIYEGLILRFMKSDWSYQDATNVVGYYSSPVSQEPELPQALVDAGFPADWFHGDRIVLDAGMALRLLERSKEDPDFPARTLWVFRYYDLNDRQFPAYGRALVRLIDFIGKLATMQHPTNEALRVPAKVNLLAHSMGGLIVRHALQVTFPETGRAAEDHVNKVVTLGTPHQGISFQVLKDWIRIDAEKELEVFNPKKQADTANPAGFKNLARRFPLERLLTVVGTDYRSYAIGISNLANRLFAPPGEFGPNYNRSDGLVKQTFAQVPGAPRTFVHKCHGGFDSLVTARESFEIATRFFFGNTFIRLSMVQGKVTRGKDLFGKSEFFFGVSLKPRRVDFDLFHQSAAAENCYGPFSKTNAEGHIDVREARKDLAFPWAEPTVPVEGQNPADVPADLKLIWEGWLDTLSIVQPVLRLKPEERAGRTTDMVFRLDFYLGERDLFGLGFSDNVIFRKQYYVRALLPLADTAVSRLRLFLHTDEAFARPGYDLDAHLAEANASAAARSDAASPTVQEMEQLPGDDANAFRFTVKGTGFEGTFQIEVFWVPEYGRPAPFRPDTILGKTA
mgnify:CR=1 FL=1|jgi:Predicted acetyltransferases and hydrolases with the alpha/beta hydrolase fold